MNRKVSRYTQRPFRLSTVIYERPKKGFVPKIHRYSRPGPTQDPFTHPLYDPVARLLIVLHKEKRLQTF